jgi:hypothetical protein
MLISRHIFFHLPYANIFSFLIQVTESPYIDYFLTTNSAEVRENVPFEEPFRAGGYRAVNLRRVPFPDDWSQIAPILTWVEGDSMGLQWMELYDHAKMPVTKLYRKFEVTPLTYDCNQAKLIEFCGSANRPKICEVCGNGTKSS